MMGIEDPTAPQDMVKRTTVTFEDDLYAQVEALAASEQRTIPNLLVYLAAKAVRDYGEAQPAEGNK